MKIIRNILIILGLISSIQIFSFLVMFFLPSTNITSGGMFDWSLIKQYSNNKHSVEAIVRYGVPNNGTSTVPFYSVMLQTISKNKKDVFTAEVWSSQHNMAPTIKWLDNNNIEILQIDEHIWEYTPSIIFNKEKYNIRLNILP